MQSASSRHSISSAWRFVLFSLAFGALMGASSLRGADKAVKPEEDTLKILNKSAPENLDDLRAMQMQFKKVLKKVIPCTVGLRVGGASGSGVIISKDGYVLTAGHVSGTANRNVTVILPDGRRVKGKTLGANRGIDSGLIQITDKGDWPYLEMGDSSKLKRGQWVIAAGHPGGFKPGRTPVVRVGRIQSSNSRAVRTDCTLVGGDSGGPLFDMSGNVIGIHSRIGPNIEFNIHVPVDTYRDTWARLTKAEVWGGGTSIIGNVPYMGVVGDQDADECKILEVVPDSPADKAGLKANDVILEFDGTRLKKYDDLRPAIRKKKIGDSVKLLVLREGKEIELTLKLGRRG